MKVWKKDLRLAVDTVARVMYDLVARVESGKLRQDDLVKRLNAMTERVALLERSSQSLQDQSGAQYATIVDLNKHTGDIIRRLNATDQRLDRLEAKFAPRDPADVPDWKAKMRAEMTAEQETKLDEIKINMAGRV